MRKPRLDRKQAKRVTLGAALALLVSGVLSVMYYNGWLTTVEQQSSGFFFQSKRSQPKDELRRENRAVIVGIDEHSIRDPRLGRWPWDRKHHAELVRRLTEARVRVIAFDVIFSEPHRDDPDLAAAMKAATDARIPVLVPWIGQPEVPEPAQVGRSITFREYLRPIPVFRELTASPAHVNVLPDEDGSVRRVPAVVTAAGEVVPALGLAAESLFLRRPRVLEGAPTDVPLLAGARAIPVDPFGRLIINYQGPPAREGRANTFDVFSYVDVLDGKVDPALLRDKAVFIGQMYAGADSYATPVSPSGQKMFGVEIHANVFETLLRAEFLAIEGIPETLLTIVLLAVLGGLILPHLRPLWATLVMIFFIAGYYFLSFLAFDRGVLLNIVYPILAIVITYVAMLIYRIVFEESEKRLIQAALGSYTSKQVMEAILANPNLLKLGGEKRQMTVLFSDIRGFTSISERLDPEALVQLLNEYLTAMTDIVFKYEGVLDKYMGDAIMAFWGAPIELKDHATKACQTALEMIQELHQLQIKWDAEGVPRLDIGIGLNTGPMSVGNMGSRSRFDYTVMGDAVNLGSRLEGLNKEYGTHVIISEFTEAAVRGQFATRPLDVVAVKGKTEPVAIFELLATAGGLTPQQERLLEVYN
jgi:adenylate cyclase